MNTILASSNRILSAQLSFARVCLLSLCWFRSNIVRFSLFPRILRSLALLGRWRSTLALCKIKVKIQDVLLESLQPGPAF